MCSLLTCSLRTIHKACTQPLSEWRWSQKCVRRKKPCNSASFAKIEKKKTCEKWNQTLPKLEADCCPSLPKNSLNAWSLVVVSLLLLKSTTIIGLRGNRTYKHKFFSGQNTERLCYYICRHVVRCDSYLS